MNGIVREEFTMSHFKKISLFILFILFWSFFPSTAFSDSEAMSFSFDIIPPENQTDFDLTYFDFRVSPNEKMSLDVTVTNTGNDIKKIKVTPTNAITNANGIVDYAIQDKEYIYDSSLKTPFTTLVSPEQTVSLEPGETKTLSFDFIAPKEAFDGIILGGFVAHLVQEEQETTKPGVSFVNQYQFVKAVVIRSSDADVPPTLVLNAVKPSLYNYRTAVTANLQNTSPTLLGDISIEANITKKGSQDIIKSEKRENVEFAPNSNFDFPIMWDNERLEPGDYTLTMNATVKKETFSFEEHFTITKNESNSVNKQAMDLKKEHKSLIFWLTLIFIFMLLLSFLGYIIYKQYQRNKKVTTKIRNERNKKIKQFIKQNKNKD